MTDFKAKMHQIRFRLGLCPRPRWGSLQRSPDPLAGFGSRFAAGEAGLGNRRERGRGRKGGRSGGEGKGGPQVYVEPGPLRALLRHCHAVSIRRVSLGVGRRSSSPLIDRRLRSSAALSCVVRRTRTRTRTRG